MIAIEPVTQIVGACSSPPFGGGVRRLIENGRQVGLLCLGLVLLMFIWGEGQGVVAQSTADAYFHEAATAYVANEVAVAQRAVEQGLAVAPSDPRLRALREKLRQKRRSRPRQDSSSSPESTGEVGREDGADSSSEEENGRSENTNRTEENRQRPDSNAQSNAENQTSRTREAPPRQPDTVRPGRGGRPVDTLSREQAERLLQALEGQERRLLRQIRRRSAAHRTVEKDW